VSAPGFPLGSGAAPVARGAAPLVVAIESLPIPTLVSRDGEIIAVNEAYVTGLGIAPEAVIGRSLYSIIQEFAHRGDVALLDDATAAQLAGKLDRGVLWCRARDGLGRERALCIRWEPGLEPGINIVYLLDAEAEAATLELAASLARSGSKLVGCRDEHEVLEQAVVALAARGHLALTLLLRGDDPFLAYGPLSGVIDASFARLRTPVGLLVELNPGFYERRVAFCQDVDRLIDTSFPPAVAEAYRDRVRGMRVVQAPLFVEERAYGALVVASRSLTPVTVGAIEMFAELVARAIENVRLHQRAAERLIELQRLQSELVSRERLAALGEAAAVMAHEVRNPISALLNAAVLLRREPSAEEGAPASENRQQLLRVVGEEASRLDHIVGSLLDLGRPLCPRLGAVDLRELVRGSVAILVARAECGPHQLAVSAPKAPVLAMADPELLQLALLNVLRNAAQASPPGAAATIRVQRGDDAATVTIDDAGAGFPSDVLPRAFEPFFTTRPTGTGIGLAVVRRTVEACGGSVELGRSAEGGGRVVLRLRLARGSELEAGR
jgi:signal transduction histidine kinase